LYFVLSSSHTPPSSPLYPQVVKGQGKGLYLSGACATNLSPATPTAISASAPYKYTGAPIKRYLSRTTTGIFVLSKTNAI